MHDETRMGYLVVVPGSGFGIDIADLFDSVTGASTVDVQREWDSEGWSRSFAVWIKWDIVNNRLRGKIILDQPLEKTAENVFDNFCDCLDKINIKKPERDDKKFDIELLRDCLTEDTVSKG